MSVTDRLSMLSPEQRALFETLREKQRKAVARPPQPPPVRRITGSTAEGDWPLSLDQERFWFMEQLYPGHAGLNITAATRMRGPMSVPAMAAGLDEIARRHAAWRTTFPMLDGRPVQRVGPARRQTLALLDLSGLPGARREPEVLRLLAEATAAPFDLERETLVRSGLARLGPRDHVCLLTIHHLVTDWISFQIAFGELAVLYDAFAAGGSTALPEPSVQYPDFAAWQREWLQGEVLEGLVSWWRERLEDFPLTLELPTDRPRPAVARMRGGRRVVGASRELSEAVRALGRREGATLFMTVLALVAALFQRLSSQEKLILGANNANRNRPELGPVLGCFLTQVPFPIDLAGDPPVRELLARVRQSALGSLAHQDLPFGKLVEALAPERDPSRQPVIQALVQVLDGQASKVELAGVAFEPVDAHDGIARYDLFLTLFDYPDGLSGSLEYDADLFDATTAERLAELLFLQAARAAADPDLRLSELPVLSEAQAQQALVEWNDTARPLPDRTLPELFAVQAKRAPDAVAVVSKGGTLTYGELDRRSDELAVRLVAAGVEPGSHVALLLGRTADVPVAIFGCWKAGAAYVPLDPEWPAERLAFVLEDAEPAALVHRGAPGAASDVPSVDLDDSGPVAPQTLPAPDPYRLAYLIYTSGTTGRPKAVMVEHRGAAAMAGCILDLGVGPDDRIPHLSRYTFDVTLLEIVLPLAAGGICEIVDTEEVLDPEGFLAVLERSTRVFTLPALLRRAVDERGQRRFAGLRTLASGGDLVPPDLLEQMLEAFPSTDLLVLYGPTETTIICTGHRLSRARKPERALIGRPLANVEARVVDAGGRPVALGVPGELWIGGPGVARGYFQRRELTAERFVEVDGRHVYRTGDLVRQVPGEGGELEFLGRIDAQVKIRGIRIEPGEIEAALRDHPAVRDAAVIAVPAGGDKQLVAYVVGTDEAETLRAFLRERLPEAMIPSVFVPLEAIPVTSHGKVDRKALPVPQAAREVKAGAELPRNAREELLAGIWRELLGFERVEGVERVGVHDNFFRLGGDSILSIQVVARARRAGLLITTRQFFDNQTIAGLAAVAESTEPSAADEGPVEGEAPLTPVQRRFFEEEPSRFNMAVMLAPRERLDAGRLAKALRRLAEHHDALRLRFVKEDGWRQIHAPDPAVPLLEIDLHGHADLDNAAEQLQSGLDLARGPLFTAALFRRGEGDRLLLTAHHLIVDGVSWRVLLEDLAAAYRGDELPPKTTSWKRWAERLNAFASEVTEELPYWLSLQSLPSLPSFPPADPKTAAEPVELGAAATRALLQEAPEAYHTQVNDLLLTALARAARAWSGESTLLVDLEGHGREEIFPGVDLSRTVGWFTTTFPVALTLPTPPDTAGPRESILAVKETLRAVPRRGLGYGLLRYVNPETSERLAALPEPRISFNYLGQLDASVGEGGLFGFAPEAPRGTRDEAVTDRPRLAVDCMVVDGRLRVICASERLARGFVSEVEALVAHCLSPGAGGCSPSDFPLARVDQAALDRLLGADRNVEDLYPLAPLQEGILFHSAHTPGDDPYFQQFTAELEGPLDVARFTGAWQSVLDRHPALRTAFLWKKVERPLQLVRKHVELPWTLEERHGSWQDLLAADRARGFDLERAPLMRLTLVRTAETSHRVVWRLVWSSHHLIFDGWCLSILLSEVFALYQGRPLPPPPRPYRDYIAWLAQRDAAEAEGFWRERLEGFTEPTPLPFDRRSAQGDPFTTSVSLPAAALGALAQRLQVTVNTLVQGAWALLLSRYAQVSDVLFGAVVSGRPAELPGVESMIGLFINTLPVRIAIAEDEPASVWLARVQEAQPGLAQHQWTPLARIQSSLAKLGPGEALFESLLVFENYPMAPSVSEGLGELRIAAASLDERTNYPLTLIVVAREDLTLRLVADRRFEPATARRILSHLERLLAGLAANPTSPPLALPLLSEAERHQATVEWNDTAVVLPAEATIHGLFARQAALTPDAVAVEMGEERLTYAGLLGRATRIARQLVSRGLRPEEPVAVLAERSPDLIASLLGILQAGGAYLPVDPAYPPERQEWMVRDAGAVRLALEGGESGATLPEVPAGSLAHVLYTSGSTGTPKGVAVTHRNVVRLASAVAAVTSEGSPDQAWLQYGPLSFDASTLEIWTPLLSGGRVVLFPGRMGSLDELARVIGRHGVTSAWLTAGLFHEMVDGRLDGLRPLRHLLTGGDVVSPDHARRVLEACPGLTLIDGYGPTENTVFTSWHRLHGPDDVEDPVPIGRPLANTRVFVLSDDLQPVPAGVWGELCAGGEGLSRGYMGRPDLTAERFVPDGFSGSGERLYRTGDRVRWRPDRTLEFQGRLDFQVKIRGFRVEPGEVEAALLACPGVQRGAVVVVDKTLRAFWVGEATADELRSNLRARLPEAMVPSVFIPLPDLPLTPNGKVDRRALAALEVDAARRAGERVAPRTALEERLAEIWSRVLEVDDVGAFDNFFDLGGHSLLATQLVTRIRDTFGVELPVSFVFEAPTLAAQAAGVAGARGGTTPGPILRLSGETGDTLPVSFAQERLWFLQRFDPASPAYNIPLAIRLSGDLDVAALESAFDGVVRRHETLRATFHEAIGEGGDGDGPVQRISPALRWTLPFADLSGLPGPRARQAEADRLGLEDALAPFDLLQGPVLRTRLLRLAPREHVLQLCIHHVAADLWSMNILVAEVAALYEGRELPPLPLQYSGFAAWQRDWLQGGELERQIGFWRRELAGAPPVLDLPTDRPRPQILSHRGSSRPFELGAGLSDAAARFAREHEATPFMVLLAALGAVASRWSGQDDLVLGTPVANRQRPELERLIGLFVNSLPMRVRLEGRPSFADLLDRVRGTALAAYEHQDVPFEKLVEELRPPRSLSRHPLFQVLLAFQNVREERLELPGLVLEPLEAEHKVAKFDLALTLFEARDGLVGTLEWATDLFDAATAERLDEDLKSLLTAAFESPETPAAELPMLTGAVSRQLLVDAEAGVRSPVSEAPQDRLAGLTREQRAALFEQLRRRKEQQPRTHAANTAPDRIPRRSPETYPEGEPVPASFAQERLWFLDRLAPGKTVFNMPLMLRITGRISPGHLEGVLGALVRRHETLRTTFGERDGQPVQIVSPPGPWTLPVVDLAGVPGALSDAEMRRLAQDEIERPFDLETGPLLRAVLLRFSDTDHALLLDMHHIVSDGWSLGVLVRDITALYAGLPLPSLPIQYADFAAWQRGWLRGDVLEKQIAWWREALAGAPASLDLPTDRPRPATQTYLGARFQVPFDPVFSRGLAQFARRHEATPYMVFLAAFQALLGRLGGQDDLTVGSPIANRNRSEVEPLIGFFVNTLVMRGDLRGDPSFQELLARARRSTLGAYAHQDLPFERLVMELRPERHLSVTPLFQAVCAMQNAPVGSMDIPGLSLDRIPFEITTSQFDLELHLWEIGDAYVGDLSYSTELFDGATILRLVAHLETLLRAVMADPGLKLSDLPLLPESERHQILHEWNDTSPPLPFRERGPGGEGPDLLALVTANAPKPLLDRAARLAGELRSLGVGPDVPVGLCVERSPELVTGALAVLLAGGAYLPMDPAWPEDRLAFVVQESGMPVLLGRGVRDGAPAWATGVKVIDLDRPSQADPVRPLPPDPDRLAYVIYTSGSTGRPKGVQIPHRGLLGLVRWHLRTYGVTREDRATLVASPAFDASVWEIWPYLAAGASLHVPGDDLRLEPERLLAWMVEEGITLSFLPTPLAEQVLDVRPPGGLRLRALLTGGDRLQQAPGEPLPFALVNHYGPTESSVVATCAGVEPGSARSPVIGRPIDGTRAYVVDRLLQAVPIGTPGELVLAGAGLARGYLGRPDLTADRFIPDPFAEEPGGRLYRTGDLVRLLPDGSLDFLGRVDTQVKLRGFRIELGEIESALLRHPAVREAVVTLRDGIGLAAYVVCRPEAQGEAEEHVSEWQTLYDETYARSDHRDSKDATFDIQGWNSSYTGQPIPAVEMREWVESTVERILALRPRRVVEIGCGTGLLLFRVAPHTESYLGIDFSRVVLQALRRRLAGLPQVTLRQGEADDWTGIAPGEADLVILNSVSQYFPGIDYLVRVLEGAVKAVKPGGAVFVGDVRSLPLLEDFAESVERFQAPPNRSEEEIQRRIRRRVAEEEELVVDPAFFQALAERVPGISGVDLLAKEGRWDNELTRYRYDVVLHAGHAGHAGNAGLPGVEPSGLPWSAFANDPLRTRLARRIVPELRRHLQSELPDYMIPSSFVLLDALPVTANGKVDRAALPEPEPLRPMGMSEEGTPPGTPEEKTMAGLWKEVLGVDEVRLEDNFFGLGGHSLLATQLVSRIRAAFGVDLPLRRLFEKPTLGDLTASLDTAGAPAAPAPARRKRTEAPLSLAQERFWYFGRTGNTAYNVASPLRLRGPLDERVLERCFREVIRRHDTLRTRFEERNGTGIQLIDPPGPCGPWYLPRVDLQGLPDRESEAVRLVREDALRPFDIVRGPLLRVALVRLRAADHVLILNCHHIVMDGWSMGVLVGELMELYRAFAAGEPSPLAELPVQYPDLAAWQRERLAGGVLEARLDWWRETLKGAPRIWSFPLDRPRSASSTHRGAWVPRVLPAGLADRLKALGTTEGASLYMVVLAGLSLVLRSWTGQDDLVVGSPLAGRERGESERMIGVFLNLLPMRIDLSGALTFRDLLRRARRTALEAYTHQEVSFEALVAALGLKREPTHNPIFQCTLNMLNFPSMGGELPGGVDVEPIRVGEVGCKYDFTLYGTDTPEGLTFNLLYAVDLFDRWRMEALQGQLREVLELAVEHPDAPIRQFPASAPNVVA